MYFLKFASMSSNGRYNQIIASKEIGVSSSTLSQWKNGVVVYDKDTAKIFEWAGGKSAWEQLKSSDSLKNISTQALAKNTHSGRPRIITSRYPTIEQEPEVLEAASHAVLPASEAISSSLVQSEGGQMEVDAESSLKVDGNSVSNTKHTIFKTKVKEEINEQHHLLKDATILTTDERKSMEIDSVDHPALIETTLSPLSSSSVAIASVPSLMTPVPINSEQSNISAVNSSSASTEKCTTRTCTDENYRFIRCCSSNNRSS
jgi:hypothetical protein